MNWHKEYYVLSCILVNFSQVNLHLRVENDIEKVQIEFLKDMGILYKKRQYTTDSQYITHLQFKSNRFTGRIITYVYLHIVQIYSRAGR